MLSIINGLSVGNELGPMKHPLLVIFDHENAEDENKYAETERGQNKDPKQCVILKIFGEAHTHLFEVVRTAEIH